MYNKSRVSSFARPWLQRCTSAFLASFPLSSLQGDCRRPTLPASAWICAVCICVHVERERELCIICALVCNDGRNGITRLMGGSAGNFRKIKHRMRSALLRDVYCCVMCWTGYFYWMFTCLEFWTVIRNSWGKGFPV